MIALGLMSGTSGDGVDAVALELTDVDTPHTPKVLGHHFVPFAPALRQELTHPHQLTVQRLAELQVILADHYQAAAKQLKDWRRAEVCGMHGQTVWHQPSPPGAGVRTTLQIGSSAALAQALQMPVVGDMRSADVALGGQGAPLVPFAHWFFRGHHSAPSLVVNFGGICNMTWATPELADVRAFDVGPGMVLSDAFAVRSTDGRLAYDHDGELSRGGRAIAPLIDRILAHPFLQKTPPRSTGREDFGALYFGPLFEAFADDAGADSARDISFSLLVASLRALKGACSATPTIGPDPGHIILTGGGAKNPTLVAEARKLFAQSQVEVAADGVLAPQHHEPATMALIAARTLHRLPSTVVSVTGAARSSICGHIHYPS